MGDGAARLLELLDLLARQVQGLLHLLGARLHPRRRGAGCPGDGCARACVRTFDHPSGLTLEMYDISTSLSLSLSPPLDAEITNQRACEEIVGFYLDVDIETSAVSRRARPPPSRQAGRRAASCRTGGARCPGNSNSNSNSSSNSNSKSNSNGSELSGRVAVRGRLQPRPPGGRRRWT